MTVLGGTALAGVLSGANGGNGGSPNGGGLLGGLFGGGNNNTCYVTEKEFYQNQLADTNIMYQNLMNTNSALCELSQRVASDEVSIAKNFEIAALNSEWQQKMNDKQFACVDEKMQWMDKFMKAYVDSATCDFIKAKHYLSPSDLADPYTNTSQAIVSVPTYQFTTTACAGNYCNPYFVSGTAYANGPAYTNNGCGCNGGESNLITLCHTCHKALHSGKISLKLEGKVKGNLKYATQMDSIRKQLFRIYPEAIETFGYITKANRLKLGVDKEHFYDACVIATHGNKFSVRCNLYKKKCVSDGDFQQTKGVRSEQRIPTCKIQGFRKFDKVRYFGKEYFIKGRLSTGYAILMDIDGNKSDFSYMPKGFKTPKIINLKRLEARSSWIVIFK